MIDTVNGMVMTRDEYNLNEAVKQLEKDNIILSREKRELLKELEVYKRALEIAVYTILDDGTHNTFTSVMYEATKETILKKAMQEARDNK